jgi:hypothetical protein
MQTIRVGKKSKPLGKETILRKIGILILLVILVSALRAWADTVETIGVTIYQGSIIKMDEAEVIIKTSKGIAHVPRPNVKSFQSGTSSASPPIQGAPPNISTSAVKEELSGKFGESAKEAVRALKKIEAKIQAGISYKDYAPALGDAQFEVNMFLEGPEAKQKPDLANSVRKALEHYKMAGSVWDYKFLPRGRPAYFIPLSPWNDVPPDAVRNVGYRLSQEILEKYPKMKEQALIDVGPGEKEAAKLRRSKIYVSAKEDALSIDKVISLIWKEASDELRKTMSILSQSSIGDIERVKGGETH